MNKLIDNDVISTTTDDIIDISLESTRKKRFRIDKDDSRIIELDTTDLSIIDRLQSMYNKMISIVDNAFGHFNNQNLDSDTDEININDDRVTDFVNSFNTADKEMRTAINVVFNSPISDICVPSGSMFDPINGKFRFEYIFDCLIPLYESDITSELSKFNARIQKHTSKYIKG